MPTDWLQTRQTRTEESIPGPLEHENLDDKAYHRLRSMIVERQLTPGVRLQLDTLARDMAVSRTPLVNALKRLAQEQFVIWVPRRGFYVREFSRRELAELYQVREALEGIAARLAAERIDDAEVAQLEACFREVEISVRPEAVRRYVDLDRQFHWRLVELSGNHQLAHTVRSVNLLIFSYQQGLARPINETFPEHEAILDALRRRDPAACEAAVRRHFKLSAERYATDTDLERAEEGHALNGATGARSH
jgi:DNA-binding GntR family transcriptional regulator